MVTATKKIEAKFDDEFILTEDSDAARELYAQSRFGSIQKGRVQLALIEAFYLFEKEKLTILNNRNKPVTEEYLLKKAKKSDPKFKTRYAVFKNLRSRGYIVKTALKFGAEFRVYDRGIKPGEDHAKWVVFPVLESEVMTWYEFAAKNRVAHSTKKRLLLGIVDAEGDVLYYEVKWIRP